MQHPSAREYFNFHRILERHISSEDFVRGMCEKCDICGCSDLDAQPVHLLACDDVDQCYGCYGRIAHGQAVIIATDGACRRNGCADAVAGCGVFFGVNSIHNKAFQLDEVRPTSQRAELHAAIYALTKVRNMFANGSFNSQCQIDEVIIKTDSEYVVKSMTTWIIKWRQNGYTDAKGLPLVNQDLIEQLDFLCDRLNDLDVQVRFAWVPRGWNMQADKAANAALDGVNIKWFDEDDWFADDVKPYIH